MSSEFKLPELPSRRQFLRYLGMAGFALTSIGLVGKGSSARETTHVSLTELVDESVRLWTEGCNALLVEGAFIQSALEWPAIPEVIVTEDAKEFLSDFMSQALEQAPAGAQAPCDRESMELTIRLTIGAILDTFISRTLYTGGFTPAMVEPRVFAVVIDRVGLEVNRSIFDCTTRPCWYKFWCRVCPQRL